jgi:H+-translocating diphosphatase
MQGAKEFLKAEYAICFIFIGVMFIIITFLTGQGIWTAFAFLIGAVVSIVCGIIGMVIATRTNYRVTFCAYHSLAAAFKTAYKAGCVMGFALVSLGLLILTVLIVLYKRFRGLNDGDSDSHYFNPLFESIAGYGLGGSFVALFGRVGGGIYTKAADVGADLVGKVEQDLPEDSPKNPATIADNVGDNVGDVAGMSADLFGSFAESTCAALVISSDTLVGSGSCNFFISNLFYPLLIIAFGIVICIFVSLLATDILTVSTNDKIESTLKVTLIVSTVLLIGVAYLAAVLAYPGKFELRLLGKTIADRTPLYPFLCTLFGLVSGLVIAAFTEYITSHTYSPVRELAESCKSGAASNVTLGLALGYFSTVVPAIFIALTAYFSNYFLGYYGVALAALGMLTNLPLSLAIDGYGPISDNAGGIAEMSEIDPFVRERTDALDAAGNTTAAIGKGFAIGSAALVSLALYGGFLHNSGLEFSSLISMAQPEIFAGLLLGAMLPYLFSAFTIKSVGKAAQGMVAEIRRQIRNDPGILRGTSEPDFKACIQISTKAALYEMIAPGLLVNCALFRSSCLPCSSVSSSAPRCLLVSSPELL